MMNRKQIGFDAVARGLALRRKLGYELTESVSPIDAAEKLGIEVRFIDLPSMEGIYVAGDAPAILLSSLRPSGRRHFTCAHELGHHVFGHGDQFDQLVQEQGLQHRDNIREYQADTFASYFLMPKTAIEHALHVRSLTYAALDALAVYALANWLGVGYSTLIQHLFYGLSAISADKVSELVAWTPKQIRQRMLGDERSAALWKVDSHWNGRAVDVETGDILLVPTTSQIEGGAIMQFGEPNGHALVRAVAPGIGRISAPNDSWATFVRVARKNFVGRSCFRFDSDD